MKFHNLRIEPLFKKKQQKKTNQEKIYEEFLKYILCLGIKVHKVTLRYGLLK